MRALSLDNQIKKYLPDLDVSEKESLLSVIKSFLKLKHAPERITLEQYNREIDEAMARMDAGEYTSHEDVVNEAKSW